MLCFGANETHPFAYSLTGLLQASPNLLEVDRIIIPINVGGAHWTIIMIDLKRHRIFYYNSTGVRKGRAVSRCCSH